MSTGINTIDNLAPDAITWDSKTKTVILQGFSETHLKELIQEADTNENYKVWQHMFIYGDEVTLKVPVAGFGIDMTERSSVTIVARKLTAALAGENSFQFMNRSSVNNPVVNLHVQEYSSKLPILFANISPNTDSKAIALPSKAHAPGNPALAVSCGVTLGCNITTAPFIKNNTPPAEWSIGSPFYWMLVRTFQEAFCVSPTDPGKSRSMFTWIKNNTLNLGWNGDPQCEMQTIGNQAVSIALRLAQYAHANYVPKLDIQLYRKQIEDNADACRVVETQFNQFMMQSTSFRERQKSAQLLIDGVDANIRINENLKKDALEKLKQAGAELQNNYGLFTRQQQEKPPGPMALAKKSMKEAIDKKKDEMEFEAFMGVLEAVGSMGSVFAGNAAAPVQAVSQVSKIAELLEQIKKIVETVEKINKIITLVDSVYKMVETFDSDNKVPGQDIEMPDTADTDVLTSTDWQVLRERWDAVFTDSVLNDGTMGGPAKSYRAEGRVLIIYGQAITNSRITISNLQNRIIQLQMKIKTYDRQKEKIQAYIEAESELEGQYFEVALLLRQRYLDVKRQLLMEILDFNDAYHYWALAQPRYTDNMNINDRIAEMADVAGKMDQAVNDALSGFKSQAVPVICHISHTLTQEEKAALVSGKSVQIAVAPEDPAFNGWGRVRVQYVQVLFEGLEDIPANMQNGGKNYHSVVQDSGVYNDRLNGKNWNFVTEEPLDRPYAAYVRALNDKEKSGRNSVVNANSDDIKNLALTFDGPYYLPAIFTTWSITLPKDQGDNNTIDYSKLSSIKLICYGNAMQDGVHAV